MKFIDQMLSIMRIRSSCRYFGKEKLSPEEIDILIRAIDCGPSSGGLRAYAIYHTDNERQKKKLQKASLDQKFISQAGIIFCLCALPKKSMEKYGERGMLYAIQDATIAGMNITFVATALGLGSCWVGSIEERKVRHIFDIPDNDVPLSLICIGKWRKQE